MRLLTIGSMYPPHHLGGYELAWQSWVAHAVAQGYEPHVLASDLRVPEAEGVAEDAAAPVERALRWYWRDHEFPRLGLRGRLAIERHNAGALKRRLDAFRPEAVVWWPMGGMSMGLLEQVRRAGIPSVAMVCDDWLVYGPEVDAWHRLWSRRPRLRPLAELITRLPTRVDLPHAARYLFLSEALRDRALRAVPDLPPAEIAYRGADTDVFKPAPGRDWGWRLLYSGRIDPRKGVDLAVEALAELPEAVLTVDGAGDTGHLEELRRLAERLGVAARVRFTRSSRDELAHAYADADAVLFPVRWAEPWGLVPLEAMAVGRPVIATGLGGSGEYLSDCRNSLLFDPEAGAGALADRVRELVANPGLRQRLIAGGFETVASFSAERFNHQVLDAVVRAVEARPARNRAI